MKISCKSDLTAMQSDAMLTQGNYESNQISLAEELAFTRLESKASNFQSVKILPDEIQAFEE